MQTKNIKNFIRKSWRCNDYLNNIISSGQIAYSINTGFGYFANIAIPDDKLK